MGLLLFTGEVISSTKLIISRQRPLHHTNHTVCALVSGADDYFTCGEGTQLDTECVGAHRSEVFAGRLIESLSVYFGLYLITQEGTLMQH